MDFKNKRIAITGSSGFLGSHLVENFIDKGADVFCLIRNEMRGKDNSRVNKIYGNLNNFKDVEFFVDRSQPDIFIHLAAQTQAHYAIKHPYLTFDTNINGTLNVLESLRIFENCKSVVVASSDKTYGDLITDEYKEDHPLNGVYPYDSSKTITDILCNSYRATYEMPIVSVRPCNIYGPGDFNYQRIVPAIIKAFVDNEEITIRNGGADVREYIHVDDVVSAYEHIIDYGYGTRKYLTTPSFNVSSGDRISTMELFDLIQKKLGKIRHVVDLGKTVEIKNQAMNSDLLKSKTGWTPRKNLKDSLPEAISFYLSHFYNQQ